MRRWLLLGRPSQQASCAGMYCMHGQWIRFIICTCRTPRTDQQIRQGRPRHSTAGLCSATQPAAGAGGSSCRFAVSPISCRAAASSARRCSLSCSLDRAPPLPGRLQGLHLGQHPLKPPRQQQTPTPWAFVRAKGHSARQTALGQCT